MRAYVINLRRRPDRREQFLRWNANKGLTFEFLDAVDGQQLVETDLIERKLLSVNPTRFRRGAVGNTLSHRAAWEMAVERKESILIFEDDAYIHKSCGTFYKKYSKYLDLGLDILYLGYNRDEAILIRYAPGAWSTVSFQKPQKDFHRFTSDYDAQGSYYETRTYGVRLLWGTFGYVVSPKGAAALLESCFPLSSDDDIVMVGQNRRLKPYTLDGMVNVLLQRGQVKGRCFFPPLVIGPNEHGDSDVVTKAAPAMGAGL